MSTKPAYWFVTAVQKVAGLRRRREVQALAVYLGAAWVLYQLVDLLADTFALPARLVRVTALILGLGALLVLPAFRWERSRRWIERILTGIGNLGERHEIQAMALYLGAAFLLYEVVDLITETFALPALVEQATLAVLAIGAPAVAPLAYWYHLTARALDRRTAGSNEDPDVAGVPDMLEPMFARAHRRVDRRTAMAVSATSLLTFSGLFLLLWTAWINSHDRPVTDPRLSVAIFPFRTAGLDAVGSEGAGYGEGVADLLAVTLDGTPGIRVIDPATAWRSLRPQRTRPARSPELGEAIEIARRTDAQRFVTGAVVRSGSQLDVTARLYGRADTAVLAAVRAGAHEDSLTSVIHRLAIDLVASAWERERLPSVPEVERYATSDAEALKAYLEAKSLSRRGLFDTAQVAIERAVALDSTFALAQLEHWLIRSWNLYLAGQPMVGLEEFLTRAMRYRDRLTPRNRLLVEAGLALNGTDADRAAFLLERVLSIDSLDVNALQNLAFTYLAYGWQLGKGADQIAAAYDRVLRADSNSVPGRANRTMLALRVGDFEGAASHLEFLQTIDSSSALVRGLSGAVAALTSSGRDQDSILREFANQPVPVVVLISRELRAIRPTIAESYFEELMADSLSAFHRLAGANLQVQLWFAQGRLRAADSLFSTPGFEDARRLSLVELFYVTGALAGIELDTLTQRALSRLSAEFPADSLAAWIDFKPTWRAGWALGAYHATFGDTTEARRWQGALGTLPGGGVPQDYRGSLQADIEARLAARRGDLTTAEREARRAYELWTIHSSLFEPFHPELAMRFHLARIVQDQGDRESAEGLYRSFGPPHSWHNFYVPLSALELGRLLEAREERDQAARYYLMALRLWEHGDPEVVAPWLRQVRDGLRRLGAEPIALLE